MLYKYYFLYMTSLLNSLYIHLVHHSNKHFHLFQYNIFENSYSKELTKDVLTAALPAIEKQIREQVAADIWEYWDACGDLIDDRDSARQAIDAIAAQIAKGADHA